mgnify:FL=1
MKILFASKCYEKDYHKFLSGAFERKYEPLDFKFDAKWLLVNNGVPPEVKFNCTDRVIDVSEHALDALRWFKLDENSFKIGTNDGYKYSIAEIVLLYLADGYDYLCYVQGDTVMEKGDGFVKKAIKVLENDKFVSVVSPYSDVNTWHNKLGLDQYFSDQLFVIRVPEFREDIFRYQGFNKDYPSYGGDSFEHKVHKYLVNNKKYRMILKDYYATHPTY